MLIITPVPKMKTQNMQSSRKLVWQKHTVMLNHSFDIFSFMRQQFCSFLKSHNETEVSKLFN